MQSAPGDSPAAVRSGEVLWGRRTIPGLCPRAPDLRRSLGTEVMKSAFTCTFKEQCAQSRTLRPTREDDSNSQAGQRGPLHPWVVSSTFIYTRGSPAPSLKHERS